MSECSMNKLLTCTLHHDTGSDCLIRSIRTVYQKCSFLTGLITSLSDLLQADHQGRIGTSKTKSTVSPVLLPATISFPAFCGNNYPTSAFFVQRIKNKSVLPRSLCSFFCFALAEFYFPSSPGACWQAYQSYTVKHF